MWCIRTNKVFCILVYLLVICSLIYASPSPLQTITDAKSYQKLTKTKNNILFVFGSNKGALKPVNDVLTQAASEVAGIGTIATVDCSIKDLKKWCKQRLDEAESITYVHYSKGEYKPYERATTVKSIVGYLKDPTGDPAWTELESSKNIIHLTDSNFDSFLSKSKNPTLVMFYAPWCGHCKHMKPELEKAANTLKSEGSKINIAAIDANAPEGRKSAKKFNVTGFPTNKWFDKGGKYVMEYGGGRTATEIVAWVKNPTEPAPPPPPEKSWPEQDNTMIIHLTETTFTPYMKDNPSVLVMFYAPWCGHCKAAKPEFEKAAATLLETHHMDGVLAAVDATQHPKISKTHGVEGYPTIWYFRNGEPAFQYSSGRKADDFVSFMLNPVEPPPPPPPEPAWSEQENAVIHLGDDDFISSLSKVKHALVMFYAPWCGHCKHMKPAYQEAAEEIKQKYGTSAVLAAVDATEHNKISDKHGVKSYPTLKYFSKGRYIADYQGPRTKQEILTFIDNKINPSKTEL